MYDMAAVWGGERRGGEEGGGRRGGEE